MTENNGNSDRSKIIQLNQQKKKIIVPGEIEIKLQPQIIPRDGNIQINLQTPEGRKLIVIIQPKDYNWENDTFLFNIGQVDLTQEAQKGKIL